MLRMRAVSRIRCGVIKLHRQAKGKIVLRARLAQALKLLHARYADQRAGGPEEIGFGGGACGMLETKGDGVTDHSSGYVVESKIPALGLAFDRNDLDGVDLHELVPRRQIEPQRAERPFGGE